jgi:hypothetical protein
VPPPPTGTPQAPDPAADPAAAPSLGRRGVHSDTPALAALPAGNPGGGAPVPAEAQAVDTSRPDRVVGDGTAASCTSAAVVDAVVGSRFLRNTCDATGPDVGGAAVRVLSQSQGRPVYVVGSTFGGAAGQGGRCANGGALSSIGVSWEVINSVITHNEATGRGANPAAAGTPGGGSGAGIYADGDRFTVHVAGSVIEDNHANEGGGAIFFVSNDRTGTLAIDGSTLRRNPSDGFETEGFPGIFFLGAGQPAVRGSTLD